jgi:hypothetical protein
MALFGIPSALQDGPT